MKTLFALGFSMITLSAGAVPVMMQTTCTADADCQAGEICAATPCPAIACDPADPTCVQPECLSYCTPQATDPIPPTGDCQTDTDCGPGYECIVVGMSGGSGCACPSDQPDCGCTAEPAPPTTEYKACSPKPCVVDADCGDAQKCVTYDVPCTDVGFAPADPGNGGAPMPPPDTTCTPQSYTQCEYAWQGDCKVDADCGKGFACKEQEDCTCSADTGTASSGSSGGSSGSDPSGGVPAPAPDQDAGSASDKVPAADPLPADCTCAPSGRFFCELQTVECNTDADCAPGLVCGTDYAVDGGTATEPATCDSAGNCSSPTPTDPAEPADAGSFAPPAPKTCAYPWKYLAGQTGGPTSEGGGVDVSTGGEAANDPQADGSTDGVTPPTGTNGDSAGGPSSNSSQAAVAAGCSVDSAASVSPLAAMLLGLVGLLTLRKSRRQG